MSAVAIMLCASLVATTAPPVRAEDRSLQRIVTLATEYQQDGRIDDAIALLKSASFCENAECRSRLVLTQAWLHHAEADRDPDNATAELRAAAAGYETVLRDFPRSTDTLTNLALVQIALGETDAASAALRRVVDAGETSPRLLSLYGDLLMQLGEQEEAAKIYERALDADPANIALHAKAISALAELNGAADRLRRRTIAAETLAPFAAMEGHEAMIVSPAIDEAAREDALLRWVRLQRGPPLRARVEALAQRTTWTVIAELQRVLDGQVNLQWWRDGGDRAATLATLLIAEAESSDAGRAVALLTQAVSLVNIGSQTRYIDAAVELTALRQMSGAPPDRKLEQAIANALVDRAYEPSATVARARTILGFVAAERNEWSAAQSHLEMALTSGSEPLPHVAARLADLYAQEGRGLAARSMRIRAVRDYLLVDNLTAAAAHAKLESGDPTLLDLLGIHPRILLLATMRHAVRTLTREDLATVLRSEQLEERVQDMAAKSMQPRPDSAFVQMQLFRYRSDLANKAAELGDLASVIAFAALARKIAPEGKTVSPSDEIRLAQLDRIPRSGVNSSWQFDLVLIDGAVSGDVAGILPASSSSPDLASFFTNTNTPSTPRPEMSAFSELVATNASARPASSMIEIPLRPEAPSLSVMLGSSRAERSSGVSILDHDDDIAIAAGDQIGALPLWLHLNASRLRSEILTPADQPQATRNTHFDARLTGEWRNLFAKTDIALDEWTRTNADAGQGRSIEASTKGARRALSGGMLLAANLRDWSVDGGARISSRRDEWEPNHFEGLAILDGSGIWTGSAESYDLHTTRTEAKVQARTSVPFALTGGMEVERIENERTYFPSADNLVTVAAENLTGDGRSLLEIWRSGTSSIERTGARAWLMASRELGRWSLHGALVAERQGGHRTDSTSPRTSFAHVVLPEITTGAGETTEWTSLEPHFGIRTTIGRFTVALRYDRRTATLSDDVFRWTDPARGGFLRFAFLDRNGDSLPDCNAAGCGIEPLVSSGIDPAEPESPASAHRISAGFHPEKTDWLTLDGEVRIAAATVTLAVWHGRTTSVPEMRRLIHDGAAERPAERSDHVDDGAVDGVPTYALRRGLRFTGGSLLTNGDLAREDTVGSLELRLPLRRTTSILAVRRNVSHWRPGDEYDRFRDPNATIQREVLPGIFEGAMADDPFPRAFSGTDARSMRSAVSPWESQLTIDWRVRTFGKWELQLQPVVSARAGEPRQLYVEKLGSDGLVRPIRAPSTSRYPVAAQFDLAATLARPLPLALRFRIEGRNLTNRTTQRRQIEQLDSPLAGAIEETLLPRRVRFSVELSF